MLRLGDVGKGVNAVAVDAQGLPTCGGRLLWVTHSYASGTGTECSKNKTHQQHFSYHLYTSIEADFCRLSASGVSRMHLNY